MGKQKKRKQSLPIYIVISIIALAAVFLLYKSNKSEPTFTTRVTPTQIPPKNDIDSDTKIISAVRPSDSLPVDVKTVLTSSEETLYIDSKRITSIVQPSSHFYNDIYTFEGSNYVLVSVAGGTVSDFVIADLDGNLITDSVVDKNLVLHDWTVTFGEKIPQQNQVIINLSKVTGEQRKGILDLATGVVSLP